MKRRSFLKTLGAGLALMAVGPTKLLAMLPKLNAGPHIIALPDLHAGCFYAPYIPIIDIEQEHLNMLSREIANEIDRDILMSMGDQFHEKLSP